MQEPTEFRKQLIRARYLDHVTGNQPIRDQYFLIRSVPGIMYDANILVFQWWPWSAWIIGNSTNATIFTTFRLIFQIPLITFYSILLRRKIRKFCEVVGSGMERVPSENNNRRQGSPERKIEEQDDDDDDEFVDEFQNEENLYENYDRRVPN